MYLPLSTLSVLLSAGVLVSAMIRAPLDERGLPITATTTFTVEATVTQTVWQTNVAALTTPVSTKQTTPATFATSVTGLSVGAHHASSSVPVSASLSSAVSVGVQSVGATHSAFVTAQSSVKPPAVRSTLSHTAVSLVIGPLSDSVSC